MTAMNNFAPASMPATRYAGGRRRLLAAAIALAVPRAHAGLGNVLARVAGGEAPARMSVVLVDVTASVGGADWVLYEDALRGLLAGNRPGDRTALAVIGNQPGSKFTVQSDRTALRQHRRLEDAENLRRCNIALAQDFANIGASRRATVNATCILDTLWAVEPIFTQARAQQQQMTLLVLSDMIEESPVANFARVRVDGQVTQGIINARRRDGLIPDLRGVNVWVVGPGGPSAEKLIQVKSFWSTFFSATGATVRGYGRVSGSIGRMFL